MEENKKKGPRPAAKAPSPAAEPAKPVQREAEIEDAIRQRAYQLWEEKGRPSGLDVEIWLQAKNDILKR